MAEENVNVQMKLVSVNEVSFMMSPGKVTDDVVPEAMQIGFSNQVQPDVENDKISLVFGIRYKLGEDIVLECVYSFDFEVKNLGQFISFKDDNKFTIDYIMPHFLSVAVGTMRGILIVKTAGTNFSKYLLPMIDVNKLFANLSEIAK